jgi:hypothetical protein
LIIFLLMLIALFIPQPASAWSLNQVDDAAGAFLAGFAGGYLAHEAGHVLVATSKGYNVDLDGVTLVYHGAKMSDADRLQVATAGFQAQWLVSEAAFFYRNRRTALSPRPDNFTAGLICSHLAISAAYMTILNRHPEGDTHGISKATGLSTFELALLLAVPATLDTWRLFGDEVPKWVPLVSAGSKGAGLVAIWTF